MFPTCVKNFSDVSRPIPGMEHAKAISSFLLVSTISSCLFLAFSMRASRLDIVFLMMETAWSSRKLTWVSECSMFLL
jgi:hypothetical protein